MFPLTEDIIVLPSADPRIMSPLVLDTETSSACAASMRISPLVEETCILSAPVFRKKISPLVLDTVKSPSGPNGISDAMSPLTVFTYSPPSLSAKPAGRYTSV